MKPEIERRWLIDSLPPGTAHHGSDDIMQYYVKLGAWSGLVTRFRKIGPRYYEAKKNGHGLERQEDEREINRQQYLAHWFAMLGQEVIKRRYYLPGPSPLEFELDVYLGQLKGLVKVEVEFDSPEQAAQFALPDWFGREVTGVEEYSNYSLAIHGLPAGFQQVTP